LLWSTRLRSTARESNLGVHAFRLPAPAPRCLHHLQGKGIKQAVFTADHGFLLQDATTQIVPFGKKTDPHRRYVIDQHERGEAGMTPVRWRRWATTESAATFCYARTPLPLHKDVSVA